MLRVGLTGELGSGKSTVGRLLAAHGAAVFSSDEMGRRMMQPGHAVYARIADAFGPAILLPDGRIDRPALARLAFDPAHPRVEELNAIVHPAVLAEQEDALTQLGRTRPDAIAVVESALIFSTRHAAASQQGDAAPSGAPGWASRFDCIVVVTAPEAVQVERFVQRSAGASLGIADEQLEQWRAEARRRLRAQRITPAQLAQALLVPNEGTLDELAAKVASLWATLQTLQAHRTL